MTSMKISAFLGTLVFTSTLLIFYFWLDLEGLALFAFLFLGPLIPLRCVGFALFMKYCKRTGRHQYSLLGFAAFLYTVFWFFPAVLIYLYRENFLFWKLETHLFVQASGLIVLGGMLVFVFWMASVLSWKTRILPFMGSGDKEVGELVTNGPHAIIRHPEYFSEPWAIIGIFLITEYSSVLLLTLWWALFVYPVTTMEEAELKERFGNEYEKYSRNVPRIFPRLKTRKMQDNKE